ncbi:MAG: hypothetical protein AAF224_05810 [Pseudomonadota bacterium]
MLRLAFFFFALSNVAGAWSSFICDYMQSPFKEAFVALSIALAFAFMYLAASKTDNWSRGRWSFHTFLLFVFIEFVAISSVFRAFNRVISNLDLVFRTDPIGGSFWLMVMWGLCSIAVVLFAPTLTKVAFSLKTRDQAP